MEKAKRPKQNVKPRKQKGVKETVVKGVDKKPRNL
jgi:hypothetical protein